MTFDSRGTRLHCEVTGSGKPLVLVHGGGLDGGAWEDLVPLLKPRFTTFCIDLRGYGRSQPAADAPPVLADDWIEDLCALLDAYGLRRAGIIGWAMGGSIAARFAARYPSRASFIAMLGTPGPLTPVKVSGISERAALVAQGVPAEEIVDRTFEYTRASISPTVLAKTSRPAERMRAALIRNVNSRYGELTLAFAESVATVDVLQQVKCAALVAVGEHDLRTPVEMSVELCRYLDRGYMKVMADCGHFYPYEQPQECARIIAEFSDGMSDQE